MDEDQIGPNMNTTPVSEVLMGKAGLLQLNRPGFEPQWE